MVTAFLPSFLPSFCFFFLSFIFNCPHCHFMIFFNLTDLNGKKNKHQNPFPS
jgi:hypothetical protein